jgi:Multiubiquitin
LNEKNDDHGKHKKFEIKIDRDKFEVEGPTTTGAQLRALPKPPIGPDRDLFLTVPGPDPDLPVKDDQVVKLKEGMHFFTAPANITPGGNAASR